MRDVIYAGGSWADSSASDTIDVVNPATEEVIDRVPAGTAADVDRAVAEARRALPAWEATPPAERAALLRAVLDGITARQEHLATLIATDLGAPYQVALKIHVGTPIAVLSGILDILDGYDFAGERCGNSLIVREPVGVVGAITPWNYPLHQVVAKVAPALAAGCTVVLKPSEVAPLAAYALADIIDEAGLPPGVFNLVSGYGPVVGEAIAAHEGVDMVSFTGSTRAGRRVAALAAESVKRVALELGGKSPNLILDDADLPLAVKVGVAKAYVNSGQTCNALTRMLVPDARYDEAVELAAKAAERYTPGDPFADGTRLGPLVSRTQLDRVRGYVDRGVAEGARLVTGGTETTLSRGYYVLPTVFADVTPSMTIAREEIFGPVLSVMAYGSEDEGVRIANDTPYGLAAAVWSADQDHAMAVGRRLKAGQVEINGGRFNPLAPFGGYKQSGVGRELGVHGLEEFLEIKSLQL
ncbi:aldehyde dehydrogenase family protein [Actinoallomurus iriomotensis]|uniref:aldehyde dehydrogenase (NAD(+)) n=1 Tax=Actinoallomurus iriomotensis TaxID=478107 RepID=A0A9W6W1Z0_9ACTN|nr:aldehyde dehydrogenase family protein [Actinoallomurus iriomotensis]GLY86406.1 aldehyde dehydrogenase [Actinoallomurus iriomotensis]